MISIRRNAGDRLDHLGQLLAQFWAIGMAMHCDGVLRCRVYKFLPAICRNRDRAVLLARVITAIDKQSSHLGLPKFLPAKGEEQLWQAYGDVAIRPRQRLLGK
jgi:hypothetical protein